MQTDPGLCREITHLFRFSPPPPRKFGPSNAEIERNFGAFRNYPLHSDAMNREMIGGGSVRGNGWVREKKVEKAHSFIRQIISSELPVHFMTSVSPQRYASLLRRCAVCVLPLSALLSFMTLTPSNIKFTTPTGLLYGRPPFPALIRAWISSRSDSWITTR